MTYGFTNCLACGQLVVSNVEHECQVVGPTAIGQTVSFLPTSSLSGAPQVTKRETQLIEVLIISWRSFKLWGLYGPCTDIERTLFGRLLTYDEYPYFEQYARGEKALPQECREPAPTCEHSRKEWATRSSGSGTNTDRCLDCGAELCAGGPIGPDRCGNPLPCARPPNGGSER